MNPDPRLTSHLSHISRLRRTIGGVSCTMDRVHGVLSSNRCLREGCARAFAGLRAQTIAPRTPQRVLLVVRCECYSSWQAA